MMTLPVTMQTIVDANHEIEPIHRELTIEVCSAFKRVVRGLSKQPEEVRAWYKEKFGTRKEMIEYAELIQDFQVAPLLWELWTPEVDAIMNHEAA
jgi:hypothetical protein